MIGKYVKVGPVDIYGIGLLIDTGDSRLATQLTPDEARWMAEELVYYAQESDKARAEYAIKHGDKNE